MHQYLSKDVYLLKDGSMPLYPLMDVYLPKDESMFLYQLMDVCLSMDVCRQKDEYPLKDVLLPRYWPGYNSPSLYYLSPYWTYSWNDHGNHCTRHDYDNHGNRHDNARDDDDDNGHENPNTFQPP